MIKRQKLTNGDSSSYVKTTNPSVIYKSKYNSYQITIRYRQGARHKYVAKSTTGYSNKEDAEEDSIFYRNSCENGSSDQWTTYQQRGY